MWNRGGMKNDVTRKWNGRNAEREEGKRMASEEDEDNEEEEEDGEEEKEKEEEGARMASGCTRDSMTSSLRVIIRGRNSEWKINEAESK